ncbi:MAG: hypothetical protein PHS34_08680, partial [Candidatus Omnitrophica bacterium]|nr:hypothetical protein [Candidatus Omnitrophota bacterium]
MASLREKVEEHLQEKEKHRKVKDVGRVAMSAKEKAAYRIISKENIDEINQDEITAYNLVKKDSVWEAISIDEQKELGVSAGACFIKVKIRESLPSKPENDAKQRKAYVYFLGILQDELKSLKTVDEVRTATVKYINIRDIDTALTYFSDPDYKDYPDEVKKAIKEKYSSYFNEYDTRRLIKKLLGIKFLNMIGKGSEAARENWHNAQVYQASEGNEENATSRIKDRRKNKLNAEIERYEKTNKMGTLEFFDYVKHNFTHVGRLTQQDFTSDKTRLNEDFFRNFIKKIAIKAQEEFDKPIELDPLDKKREDDWSWSGKANEEGGARIRSKAINTKVPLSYIKRSKGYKTPEPTPENVVSYYGFSAYNFGRYVPDRERAEHAKHFIAALTDLGEILDINIKQVHELVGLGFGVGLKGHGGHLAAYFPQTKDINLVRGKGDGSVAHEWGHFFDNMLADFKEKKAVPLYGSDGHAQDETIHLYFTQFREFCSKGVEGAINHKSRMFRAYEGSGEYPHIVILEDIDKSLEQLFKKTPAVSYYNPSKFYANYQKQYIGYIIKKHGFSEYPVSLKLHSSVFFQDSLNAGTNSKYWTSYIEMFARSFETYIFHKLTKAGMENNYLAHDQYLEVGMPYPRGAEYEGIETIIDKIITRFKEAYQIESFTPIINERIGEEITEIESRDEKEGEKISEDQEQVQKTQKTEQKTKKMVKMIRIPRTKVETPREPDKTESLYNKQFLREQDGSKIYLVNGEAVRKDHIEFTMGGHGYVYDWIPIDEIWIDEVLNPEDREYTINDHEIPEVRKMRDEGWSYEKAHEYANEIEKKARNKEPMESEEKSPKITKFLFI